MTFELRTLLRPFTQLTASLLGSRFISVAALSIFSAICGPEPFATFGIYFAVISVGGVLACGRYEHAIIFAETPREALHLAWLAAIIACGIAAVAFLIWNLLAAVNSVGVSPAVQQAVALVPAMSLSIAARALLRILSNLGAREANYNALAYANWTQAISQGGLQLGLLVVGVNPIVCLIVADIGGVIASTAVLAAARRQALRLAGEVPTLGELSLLARNWLAMPIWDLPTSLLSVVALSCPALMLPIVYSANLAGQLILAMRILEMSSNILTGASTPLIQREFAYSSDKPQILRSSMLVLTLGSTTVYSLGALATILGSGVLVGTRWAAILAAIPYLAAYFAALTVSGPLVSLVAGLRAQRKAVPLHATFLGLNALVASLMAIGLEWRLALAALSASMVARAIMFSVLLLRLANATEQPARLQRR
ncbi:MAG: hypothetical protein AB7E81_03515 [Hyphomicrobiaceae bacterium]